MRTVRATARALIRTWAAVETTSVPLKGWSRCNRNRHYGASICPHAPTNCEDWHENPMLLAARLKARERAALPSGRRRTNRR